MNSLHVRTSYYINLQKIQLHSQRQQNLRDLISNHTPVMPQHVLGDLILSISRQAIKQARLFTCKLKVTYFDSKARLSLQQHAN